MSREIKFRAWNGYHKEMVPVHQLNFSDNIEGLIINDYDRQKRLTLMQYTGLKDKDGTDIYEGDVVRTPAGVSEVFWFVDGWAMKQVKTREGYMPLGWHGQFEREVIGNIYENPELLPGGAR